MNSRGRINQIFSLERADRVGYWLCDAHPDTIEIYCKALGLDNQEQLFDQLGGDCRWICPEWTCYKHPEGKTIFNEFGSEEKLRNNQPGELADCTSIKQVEDFDWPRIEYVDFSETIEQMKKYQDVAVMSGMWTCFFHRLCNLFGMDNYFIKMYTDPEIVEAATEHVVNFYLEANELFFQQAGDHFDIFFFGNDFGSQNDLLVSPEIFEKFILPGFTKNIQLAKEYGKKVLLHSCGAIDKVIPMLIDAGVDALHPLQAKAADMDADSLAKKYKDKIAFVGGVDTQDLLVNSTPEQITQEVKRLKDVLGPHLIVSPSHDTVLPNVPLENIQAMMDEALK